MWELVGRLSIISWLLLLIETRRALSQAEDSLLSLDCFEAAERAPKLVREAANSLLSLDCFAICCKGGPILENLALYYLLIASTKDGMFPDIEWLIGISLLSLDCFAQGRGMPPVTGTTTLYYLLIASSDLST